MAPTARPPQPARRSALVLQVGPGAGFAGAPGPVPQRPRRKLRRGQLIGIISGGTAVVLLLVAGVVGYSVGSASHSADRPVRAFLDDLTAGRVADALDDAGIERGKSDVLLGDAAYAKASDKVTGYRVAATRTDGDTATVRAYLRQGGQDVAATFTLDKTGTDWGVFPVWELQAPELGSVDVAVRGPSGASVTVAGRNVRTAKDGTVSLRALPGTYDVAFDGGKWTTARGGSADVSGFGRTTSTPVQMTTTLTTAGQQAAKRAVDDWVDGCIASTDAAPAGCSFYACRPEPGVHLHEPEVDARDAADGPGRQLDDERLVDHDGHVRAGRSTRRTSRVPPAPERRPRGRSTSTRAGTSPASRATVPRFARRWATARPTPAHDGVGSRGDPD
ncbi:hypothetical protein Q9Q99_11695 [Curtobacterium flaccumfaciens]|nr:hypothetical protein Q9Q99_11695 [Curtobacterium flaccumfaciens]